MSTEDKAVACFESGLAAYRSGDFQEAVKQFLTGLEAKRDAWEMRLYLGMAYARLSQPREAKQEFLMVRDFAGDSDLRKKAASALGALTPSASMQSMRRLSDAPNPNNPNG